MPSDHRDKERGNATPLARGVEGDPPLELIPAAAEGVGNRQRVRALEDRAVLPQFHQEAERTLEVGFADQAVECGVEFINLTQGPAVEPGPVFCDADLVRE